MSLDIVSYLMGKASGGGGGVEVEALSVTENGTYTADTGKAYSPVTVNVGGDPALPAEYQEVEYLHNDGNCWCEINHTPVYADKVEIAFSLDTAAPTTECGIVGTNTSPNWEIYTQNNSILFYGTGITGNPVHNISRDTKYTVSGRYENTGYASYANKFYWGRYRTDNYPFTGKMYYCRVYAERGQLHLDWCKLVPCYRKADNVPGFYDVINSAFYTNSGTGTFVAGPDVN